MSLYSLGERIHTLNVKMGTLRASTIEEYKYFDDYT